jgi:hypothetical protein
MYRMFIKAVLISMVLLAVYTVKTYAQIDTEAVVILDKMSDNVTELGSCSFIIKTEYDIYSSRLGLVKNTDEAKVFLKAPDKLLVNKKGDAGEKSLYCDGKTLTYYSADNNQYSVIPALSTIMETIDSVHNEYGIDFPAADMFYPDLVDELIDMSDNMTYLGLTRVEDRECHHIAGTTDEITYQIWITSDDFLPLKMAINYVNRTGSPQFEALYLDWKLNPVIDDSMFNFAVPEKANKITFKKVK